VIAFGPVPSRRLGKSLGINNIPPKTCTYSCVYCQVGRTTQMQVERRAFYTPSAIMQDVQTKVQDAVRAGAEIDYLTFVPDGEPTLDIHLTQTIALLKSLDIPLAVITNGSLLWQPAVRQALHAVDWVSIKVDAVDEPTWRKIDRPRRALHLPKVLEGMAAFAAAYQGKLVTETMLVDGINDQQAQLEQTADFIARLQPGIAYLSIPTRPPAEKWVQPSSEASLARAYQILSDQVRCVEYLIGYEGNAFAFTGHVQEDLLSITAVHPMRRDAVEAFLDRAGADWQAVDELIDSEQLIEIPYEGHRFYLRKLGKNKRST